MTSFDPMTMTIIAAALGLGGLLKGATGAGTPIVAVPVIAAFFDVRLAVAVLCLPNLCTNLAQMRRYGGARLEGRFTPSFVAAGALGALAGTVLLTSMPGRMLLLLVNAAIIAYIALRLLHPDFRLARRAAGRLAFPVGLIAGILQGAAGISAPVSLSFLNAMRLRRESFIFTISTFFAAMSAVQIPALYVAGLLTPQILLLSLVALVPLFAAIPVGAWLARSLSPDGFDKLTLLLLCGLALRLTHDALSGPSGAD
ncbi:MAG: sulfite exporter TauE/SafE family protein [Roseovarius sp.]